MILLSYPLSIQTPIYGNGEKVIIDLDKQTKLGESCNTLRLAFSNHAGTHIDCPYHFSNQEPLMINMEMFVSN